MQLNGFSVYIQDTCCCVVCVVRARFAMEACADSIKDNFHERLFSLFDFIKSSLDFILELAQKVGTNDRCYL